MRSINTFCRNILLLLLANSETGFAVTGYEETIAHLHKAISQDPANNRLPFHLAEQYKASGQFGKAIEWYQKRIHMCGWKEEIYCAKLQVAHSLKALKFPLEVVIEAYKCAIDFRPHRLEATYYLAELYNQIGRYRESYELLAPVKTSRNIDTTLLVENWIEEYGIIFQLSISAYYIGYFQESFDACNELLSKTTLPDEWRTQTELNQTYPFAKIYEK